jgi:hypothetical protein
MVSDENKEKIKLNAMSRIRSTSCEILSIGISADVL